MTPATVFAIGFGIFCLYAVLRKKSWTDLEKMFSRNKPNMTEGDYYWLHRQASHARNPVSTGRYISYAVAITVAACIRLYFVYH